MSEIVRLVRRGAEPGKWQMALDSVIYYCPVCHKPFTLDALRIHISGSTFISCPTKTCDYTEEVVLSGWSSVEPASG